MQAYFRNKRNGEIKLVEVDGQEMLDLKAEVGADGMSLWEQTSQPHASEIKERASFGELRPEDLGHDDQDAARSESVLVTAAAGPEPTPWKSLTPAEIEAGLTPEQKEEDLRSQLDEDGFNRLGKIYNEAADRIADERKEREPAAQAAGMRARAGGSDERQNVPIADASNQQPSGADSGSAKKANGDKQPAPSGSQGG